MLFLLLALQDVPKTAVEAEQAMERAAQTEGQWTAANRFAAPDAIVLGLPLQSPREAYAGQDAGPAYHWWVSDSYVSCDGNIAVNTGPWERKGRHGWFTTVWRRQADGSWKWTLDNGDALAVPRPRPDKPRVRRAACFKGFNNLFGVTDPKAVKSDFYKSPDGSIMYAWNPYADGSHDLNVLIDSGHGFETVIEDKVIAPR